MSSDSWNPNSPDGPTPWGPIPLNVTFGSWSNLSQEIPHATEFPGTFCWDDDDAAMAVDIGQDDQKRTYLKCTRNLSGRSHLGTRGFGSVSKVFRPSDGYILAGKHSSAVDLMRTEAHKLQVFQHRHIVKYMGWCEIEGKPESGCLLTELCAGCDLGTYMENLSGTFKRSQVVEGLRQISSALEFLHTRGFFHTDVKPHNIFIRSLKEIDLALGDMADVQRVGFGRDGHIFPLGTKRFRSPEIVRTGWNAGPGDDIWGLGLTALFMVGLLPRIEVVKRGNKSIYDMDKYPQQCYEFAQQLVRLNPGDGLVKLISDMLEWDVHKRATASRCAESAMEVFALKNGADVERTWKEVIDIKTPDDFEPRSFW